MTVTANQLTIGRIAAVPVICLLLAIGGKITATLAFLIFIAAAVTDYFDGYLARKHKTVSVFGRVFDAIADKLLVGGCIIALAYGGGLTYGLIIPALAIILREFFVAGLREYILQIKITLSEDNDQDEEAAKDSHKVPLASSRLAKIKTTVQMVAIGFLILAPYYAHPYLAAIGGFCFWIAAALSLYTAYEYWCEGRPIMIRDQF
jgi:cardiolipin synthase